MNIAQVQIGIFRGKKGPMWSPSASEVFGLGGTAKTSPFQSSRISLGQNAQESYVQAKPEIAKFDSLVVRVARIANKTERDRLIDYYGLSEPGNKDKAFYMRNATASCVAEAEKYTPIAYEQGFPAKGPCRGRVTKLRNWNADLEGEVLSAENYYGILPEPVIIERYVTGPQTAEAGSGPWPYIIAGGGALALLALVGVFK